MFNEYYSFNNMMREGKVPKSTLYKMIKQGKIRVKEIGTTKLYSLKDVINNKPRKK